VRPLVCQEPSASLKEADADYREGVAALSRNDIRTAKSKFEAVVKLAPAESRVNSALGAVLVREGQNAAGIRELQKALAIKANDGSAQMNLALAYERQESPRTRYRFSANVESTAVAEGQSLSTLRTGVLCQSTRCDRTSGRRHQSNETSGCAGCRQSGITR